MSKHPGKFGKVPDTNFSLLSLTTKMPCASFSLPAHAACPRENGDICGDCYAAKGFYYCHFVKNAQAARFKWTVASMCTATKRFNWTLVMIKAIRETGLSYFRVHDSGDMFNVAYAECWWEVCRELPNVKFWIPTRSWQQHTGQLPIFDPLLCMLRKLAALPNVTVRPSALNFGDYAPIVEGLHAGSTADNFDVLRNFQCPAYLQGGQCRECRTCWDHKDLPVSYCRH